jgi:hypothetical protein
VKSGFEDTLGVAEPEVVDTRDAEDADVTKVGEEVVIEDDDELAEGGTVPLRIYNESRLPTPVEFVKNSSIKGEAALTTEF